MRSFSWLPRRRASRPRGNGRAEPRPADHVVCTERDGCILLLDTRTERFYRLEGAGCEIWTLLADGADARQITARLLDTYDAEQERVAADVAAFLRSLRSQGLLA